LAEASELSPRERRQLRTHESILDAARRIVQQEGVDALSMRAIAEQIDYSPATLYEYFGSKDEIIQAICVQGHRALYNEMAQIENSLPVHDYVVELGLVYIRFAVANPDYFRLMFNMMDVGMDIEEFDQKKIEAGETNFEKAILLAMMKETTSFSLLLMGILRGIQEGVFVVRPDFGLLEMAYGCWSLVHGLASLRIAHESRFPVDYTSAERDILVKFMQGLGD
jgi:AcrR family transcriptional regulator